MGDVADATVMLRHLPAEYASSEDVIGGMAAAIEEAQDTGEAAVLEASIGGAEGKWLTLLARGYGVTRATGETDGSLRGRLRNVEDKVTPQAILDAVNSLLAPYTATEAELVEWFEGDGAFWLDYDYLDDQRLFGEWHTFYLIVPLLGEAAWGDFYVDSSFLDDEFIGAGPDHPVYAAIVAEVERLRAAGIRWLLITE